MTDRANEIGNNEPYTRVVFETATTRREATGTEAQKVMDWYGGCEGLVWLHGGTPPEIAWRESAPEPPPAEFYMVLARKRDAGYYDRWQVIAHCTSREYAEQREQEFAKRAKKSTTVIVTTHGKPYSTVPGNGAEPAFVWQVVEGH